MTTQRYKLYAHHMQDVGCYLLTGFQAGVNYRIKGRDYEVPHYTETKRLWVEVTDLEDVGLRAQVVDQPAYYLKPDGTRCFLAEYYEQKKALQVAAFEEDDGYSKVVIDREAYDQLKAMEAWERVEEVRKWVCDASLLDFEIIPDQFLSGSVFVVNLRPLEPQSVAQVWLYKRFEAVSDEILKTFARLGTVSTGGEWVPRVNDGNCWGNSTHSGWRYLKAWGQYVWEDKHEYLVRDKVQDMVGTLEQMQRAEAADRQVIRSRIEHQYRAHFAKENLNPIALKEVTQALAGLISKAKGLKTMQRSATSRHSMLQALEELQQKLSNS